jgi:LmbE family N-acetylglucosaminyl deacetylase
LGAGGTIAAARRRGLAVRVAFVTNGDGSRSTQIEQDTRLLRRNTFQQLAAMRQRETVAALKELNVSREDIVFSRLSRWRHANDVAEELDPHTTAFARSGPEPTARLTKTL